MGLNIQSIKMSGTWGYLTLKGHLFGKVLICGLVHILFFESCSCFNFLVTTLGLDLFSVAYLNKFTVLWCPATSRQLDLRGPPF